MNPQQIAAYIEAGVILIGAGRLAIGQVREMFQRVPEMTETELNDILSGVEIESRRRAALARADAGGV